MYCVCRKVHQPEKLENKQGISELLTHLQYCEWLVFDLIYVKKRAHNQLSLLRIEEYDDQDQSASTRSTNALAGCSTHPTTREQYRAFFLDSFVTRVATVHDKTL